MRNSHCQTADDATTDLKSWEIPTARLQMALVLIWAAPLKFKYHFFCVCILSNTPQNTAAISHYSFTVCAVAIGRLCQCIVHTYHISILCELNCGYLRQCLDTKCIQSPFVPKFMNTSLRECAPPAKLCGTTANGADICTLYSIHTYVQYTYLCIHSFVACLRLPGCYRFTSFQCSRWKHICTQTNKPHRRRADHKGG